jgi:hypothetical protein
MGSKADTNVTLRAYIPGVRQTISQGIYWIIGTGENIGRKK